MGTDQMFEAEMSKILGVSWTLKGKEVKIDPDPNLSEVAQDGLSLQWVKKQTPKICLAAVTQNGWALQFVYVQTEPICLAAVAQNGLSLRWVKHQTEHICIKRKQFA